MKLILVLIFLFAIGDAAERPARPNIVLILVDDLGWQDVGCYDIDEPSPMETPHLDRLATRGVMFRQGYAPAPTCAPSRAAILSGWHPARAQLTHVSGGVPPAPHHIRGWDMMSPWYSARMHEDRVTIAEALKANGYTTGHSGKWHVAMGHHGFPQPEDQGFDYSRSDRGVQKRMQPDRLSEFATTEANDPYRLDRNGFCFDQTHHDAMHFLRTHNAEPFFLYYATWLVHSPNVMRSEKLLRKYVKKLGVTLTEEAKTSWPGPNGQHNPFYCAMVEQLDYYLGQMFTYLETTEDPRWPGHTLSENTYIIFTSDNGGMEGTPTEVVTDNSPLDKGKISLMEGGTRVPLIIVGPDISAGVDSGVMVNGLDFYPTILSLTETQRPEGGILDGCDLTTLLRGNPTDPTLVRHENGQVRDTMVWHFPNSSAFESSIRIGDYKLVRNYHHHDGKTLPLELYQLYETKNGRSIRGDIEEANNLVGTHPEKAAAMNARLTQQLEAMGASYPYYNPHSPRALPQKHNAPSVTAHSKRGNTVTFQYRENGARVVGGQLIYTKNGGQRFEEWFRKQITHIANGTGCVNLPEGTTHYYINLFDQNRYLISYPPVVTQASPSKNRTLYTTHALPGNTSR